MNLRRGVALSVLCFANGAQAQEGRTLPVVLEGCGAAERREWIELVRVELRGVAEVVEAADIASEGVLIAHGCSSAVEIRVQKPKFIPPRVSSQT